MKKFTASIWIVAIFLSLLLGCSRYSARQLDLKIDIGMHNMHIYCTGIGSPTVVLDTGSGETYHSWMQLIESVAKETRVCAYDRAGYGQSELGPLPRDSSREVNELYLIINCRVWILETNVL